MSLPVVSRYAGLTASAVALWMGVGQIEAAIAQALPCQPPAANEYLLLVADPSETAQARLRQLLPTTADISVCNYLDDGVTRVGGFTDASTANAWAQYLTDIGGLQTFVARPSPSEATPVAASETPPEAIASATPAAEPIDQADTAYAPQPLGAGYAVLVHYGDRPEVAAQMQTLLAREIGLVSYQQRPYLLAVHTGDPVVASSILRILSDRNFSSMIVDSRSAMLLTPAVVLGD